MNEVTNHLIKFLDNDEGMYRDIMSRMGPYKGDLLADYYNAKEFGEEIRDEVIVPGDGLLGHMLGLVEWDQLGKHFLEG